MDPRSETPGKETIGFAADSCLGKLAKWLRILGFDTLYVAGRPGKSLFSFAKEKRVLLTRSTALLNENPRLRPYIHSSGQSQGTSPAGRSGNAHILFGYQALFQVHTLQFASCGNGSAGCSGKGPGLCLRDRHILSPMPGLPARLLAWHPLGKGGGTHTGAFPPFGGRRVVKTRLGQRKKGATAQRSPF